MASAPLLAAGLLFVAILLLFSSVALAQGSCDPNERFVNDADGRRFLELRWPIGSVENRVRLRVPAEYVTWADTGCQSAVVPGYPDPNYTNPFAGSFDIGMSLPDFQTLPPPERNTSMKGLDWTKLLVEILTTARAKGGEDKKRQLTQTGFENSQRLYLNSDNFLMRQAKLTSGRKPDKYRLKRVGVIGDMEHFKTEYGGGEAVDLYYVDHDPLDLWFKCGAEEIKDHTEDAAWHKRPLCAAHFRYVRLDVAITLRFPRIYMQIWPEIKARTEKILDSFEIDQLTEGKL